MSQTKTISVSVSANYGREAIYPVCADAKIFAEMLGRKTLTRADIRSIKALGYTVIAIPAEVAL